MNIQLSPEVAADGRERQLILSGSREMGEAVFTTMLNTFSKREAGKKLIAMGFSKPTAKLLVTEILKSAEVRSELSESYKNRTVLCAVGSAFLAGSYFVADVPTILVKLTAISLVYGMFSGWGWFFYSRPPKNPFLTG